MSERLSSEKIRSSCVQWAKLYSPVIYDALHRERISSLGLLRRDILDKSLSEQRLCKAMDSLILPVGFTHIQRGGVEIYSQEDEHPIEIVPHHFAALDDFVLCITPGQFFDKQKHTNVQISGPGDRVKEYEKMDTGLITLLPNGIGVLHGTIKDIKQKLFLGYRTSPLIYDLPTGKWK